jgi:hypothetical protein
MAGKPDKKPLMKEREPGASGATIGSDRDDSVREPRKQWNESGWSFVLFYLAR